MDLKENLIEFYSNDNQATVTFNQQKFITKIKKLSIERPEEVSITHTNKDGSIVAHIPVSYIKLNPPKVISEERKEVLRENARKNLIKT